MSAGYSAADAAAAISQGFAISSHNSFSNDSAGSTSTPIDRTPSACLATATKHRPPPCEIEPTVPSGQMGVRSERRPMDVASIPSSRTSTASECSTGGKFLLACRSHRAVYRLNALPGERDQGDTVSGARPKITCEGKRSIYRVKSLSKYQKTPPQRR